MSIRKNLEAAMTDELDRAGLAKAVKDAASAFEEALNEAAGHGARTDVHVLDESSGSRCNKLNHYHVNVKTWWEL